jgi:signal peptidase II
MNMDKLGDKTAPSTLTYVRRAVLVLAISVGLAVIDQLVKAWIVGHISLDTVGFRFWNDFLWIVHTRNLGIAFSIGDSLSQLVRIGFFIVLPLVFLVAAFIFCVRSASLNVFQRVSIAIVAGGGLGNLIDRIFRPEGVVDFVSFSLFGIFGLDRFPTFNVADACISVGACLVIISGFFLEGKNVQRP